MAPAASEGRPGASAELGGVSAGEPRRPQTGRSRTSPRSTCASAERLEPYGAQHALLMQIPGVDWLVAAVLIGWE
jgi:hypothetical protein